MPFLFLAALVFLGLALGILALLFLDPEFRFSPGEELVLAIAVGFTVLLFLILGVSLAMGEFGWASIGGSAGIVFAAVIYARRAFIQRLNSWYTVIRGNKKSAGFAVAIALAILLLVYAGVLATVFTRGSDGTPRAILKGWGDGAYHMDMIEFLANISPFRLTQPIASGASLTYPLAVDFFSALLRKFGLSIFASWHVPVFVFGFALFFAVFFLGRRLLRKDILALYLLVIVFFGGGLGFAWFFRDVSVLWQSSQSGGALARISFVIQKLGAGFPHEYTHLDIRTGGKPEGTTEAKNIVWITPAISFFSHQRSFVLGALLSIAILLGLFAYWDEPRVSGRWIILAGLLPLAHTHSFLAMALFVLPVFFFYAILRDKNALKWWLSGGLVAVAIALPQIMLLAASGALGPAVGTTFFRLWPGWMMCTHNATPFRCDPGVIDTTSNIIWFWLKNFGIVFLGWVAAILTWIFSPKDMNPVLRRLLLPSFLILAVSHLILFQAWEFDNNKVIFYWWLFAAALGLGAMAMLMERIRPRRVGAILLFVFVILGSLAGFLDVANRFLRRDTNSFGYYGKGEMEAAAWIRANTKPTDVFLTGDGANEFVPMLTGRAIYLGFTGWLWTQGRQDLVSERQSAAENFLAAGDPAGLCRDGVGYVVWDSGLLYTYSGANFSRIASFVQPVFTESANGAAKRIIFKLKC